MVTSESFIAAVYDYINDGGKFVGWLHGHKHAGYCSMHVSNGIKQLNFTLPTSSASRDEYFVRGNSIANSEYDRIALIGIDTNRHLLKICVFGAIIDKALQNRELLVYDYNKQIIL